MAQGLSRAEAEHVIDMLQCMSETGEMWEERCAALYEKAHQENLAYHLAQACGERDITRYYFVPPYAVQSPHPDDVRCPITEWENP